MVQIKGHGEVQRLFHPLQTRTQQPLVKSLPDLVWPSSKQPRIHVSVPFPPLNPQAHSPGADPLTAAAAPLPQKVPRTIRLSAEALSRMGMAEHPLAMREVRALTLALAEAVEGGNTVREQNRCVPLR